MSGQCSICLGEYDEPVCIPCGHVYCIGCITDVVNAPEETGTVAKCPTCRSEFHLVVPDLAYLPKKYHPFIVSPLRRVYLDESIEVANLEREVTKCKVRLAKAEKNEEVLIKECERHQKKSRGYRLREQEARLEKEKLEKQCDQLVEKVSKVEAEVEHKEAAKMRLLAKNLALQRDMKKLQEENDALVAKFNALKVELEESPKKQHRRNKSLVCSDDSDAESETAPSSPRRIVRPLPRRTRKFSSGTTSLSPKAPAPKKARISDSGLPPDTADGRLPIDTFTDFRKQAYRSFVSGGRSFE